MLTRKLLQASGDSSGQMSEMIRYYLDDEAVVDYYSENMAQSLGGESYWIGTMSAQLGLSGTVQRDDLKQMMFGHAPNGQPIRFAKQQKEQSERILVDLCFSPPKSYSIAALVLGEKRFIELHQKALSEVFQFIEREFAAARIQIAGNRQPIKTANLAAAALTHYTARPVQEIDGSLKVDPQLHTHVLVMNGTLCPDGSYRALFNEDMCYALGLDNIYKNALAHLTVEEKVAIRNTANGFELAAISDDLIEAYSSRTNLAKALCQKKGLAQTPENIKAMSMRSRLAKQLPKTLDEMMIEWAEEGKALGLTSIPRDENAAIEGRTAREMLDSAIRHYSERSTSFTKGEIQLYVFQHPQPFGIKDLVREIAHHEELIPIGDRFTTYTALNLEKQILDLWFARQQQAEAYAPKGMTLEHELNHKQRAVVEATLQCRDRDQLWQGISGAGKTRSLGALKQELDHHGVKVRGFAPGIQESKELARELGIETNTVASLVLQEKGLGRNELWIIDEAGKLSTKQLKTIQDKAEMTGSRLLLVGDKNQNAAIEAGSPFRQLQRYGATTHRLDKIIRQQDAVQKRAVELIANGQGLESLSLLCEHGYVNEIKDPNLKVEQIALDYLSLSQAERAKTLIVSGTNAEAKAITAHIREGLREEGLIGEDLKAKQVVSRQLTTEQKQQLYNYQKGDLIRLHGRNPNKTLKVGELYKVAAIHADDLTLINANGKHYRFSPKRYKNIEVYTTQNLQIAKGDRLRWTHSNRKQGRINGATVDVVDIQGSIATLRSKTGKLFTVDLSKPVDLSHSLVSTNYRAQGQSEDRVLMSATADPTSMREAFYVAISRQKWFLKIYTQDLDKIRTFITQSNTQKNALELINEQHRIEAERYRGAIESIGKYRHQHPFIYSAIASLAAGAIRNYTDQALVRRELERLYQQLERTHRGIKQLTRHLTGQNRPIGEQRLAYIQEYQAIEAELSLFLDDFEQDIRDIFGPELEDIIESYDFDEFPSESEQFEMEPPALGEYCPVDIPQLEAIAIEHQIKIPTEETIGTISIDGEDSKFDLLQLSQAQSNSPAVDELEVIQTIARPTQSEPSKALSFALEVVPSAEAQVMLLSETALRDFGYVDEVEFGHRDNTQHSISSDIDRSKTASTESPSLDKAQSPSEVQPLSQVVQPSKNSIEPPDLPMLEASETVIAPGLQIQLDHQGLPTVIATNQWSRTPKFTTDLVDFDLAVMEAEKIAPLPQSEASILSIGETATLKTQAFKIKAEAHDTQVLALLNTETVAIEPWLQIPEPRLITSPSLSFTTGIVEADELGIIQSVQIELGTSTISDITVEAWGKDTTVIAFHDLDSSPTIDRAVTEEQILAVREIPFDLTAIELSSLEFNPNWRPAEKSNLPGISVELSPLAQTTSQNWQVIITDSHLLEPIVLQVDEPTFIQPQESEVFRPSAPWEIIPPAIALEIDAPIALDLKLIDELEFVTLDQIPSRTLKQTEITPTVQFHFGVPEISAITIESWETKPAVDMKPQMLITQSGLFEPPIITINPPKTIPSLQIDSPRMEVLEALIESWETTPTLLFNEQSHIPTNSVELTIEGIRWNNLASSLSVQSIDVQKASTLLSSQLEFSPKPIFWQQAPTRGTENEHRALPPQTIIKDSKQPEIELTELEVIPEQFEVDSSYIREVSSEQPCNTESDLNNKDDLEMELIQFQSSDLTFIVNQSPKLHHGYDSNQSHKRTTFDGNREPEALDPTVRTTDRTERFSDPEPFDQKRAEHLYGESHQQGETHSIQSLGNGHRPQEVDRAGYGRSLGEPQPYPRQRQLHHGKSAVPQSNYERDGGNANPGEPDPTARDWTDALAEYRVLKEVATPLREVVNALQQLQQAKEELRQARLLRVVPKPKLIPVFWKPKYRDRDRPQHVSQKHWKEFINSAIHPDLIKLNLSSIQGWSVLARLLEDKLNQMSSGQFPTKPMIRLMNRYQALSQAGGWWGTAGVDPFNHWKPSRWGCFKGDRPRIVEGEPVKYEHPKGTERQFFLANMPDWLTKDILAKHGIEFHKGDNFWKIVHERNLPITYIEGYKKSLAALSQGEIAIGIPGVNALYRANEKVNGEKFRLPERELTRPAQFWATPGREIRWAFDKDTKLKSILNVQRDMVRAIELMPHNTHRVLDWNAKHKGVDDLIAQAGPRTFARSVERAGPADRFIKAHYRRLYNQYRKHGINDSQIWLSAAREGDIHDGDRVLRQSDAARKHPDKADAYIKQQKTAALELIQRHESKQSAVRSRRR